MRTPSVVTSTYSPLPTPDLGAPQQRSRGQGCGRRVRRHLSSPPRCRRRLPRHPPDRVAPGIPPLHDRWPHMLREPPACAASCALLPGQEVRNPSGEPTAPAPGTRKGVDRMSCSASIQGRRLGRWVSLDRDERRSTATLPADQVRHRGRRTPHAERRESLPAANGPVAQGVDQKVLVPRATPFGGHRAPGVASAASGRGPRPVVRSLR